MNFDLINSINTLSASIKHLDYSMQTASSTHWWNTQWFSAVIGALTGFIGSSVYSSLKNRNKKLFDTYQWFLEQGTFSDPDGLLMKAIITQYQNEDKPLGEKMVIELRSHTKYWYEPYGMFRFLLSRYEKSVWKIKSGTRTGVKDQPEYKEAVKRFEKVMNFVYKKTGENEWTV